MTKRFTAMSVYREDLREMEKYRLPRKIVPDKKPGRGRSPSTMESNAELFRRIFREVIESGELTCSAT